MSQRSSHVCRTLLLLLCAVMSGSVAAQDPPNDRGRWMNWLRTQDRDGDGRITREESRGPLRENFDRIDTDGDGVIERGELQALGRRLAQQNDQGRRGVMSTEALRRRLPDGLQLAADVRYREGDSEAWKLDMIYPAVTDGPPRPGLVIVHGGGWRNGDKRSNNFIEVALGYAQRGYVCATVNYRLVAESKFPACIEDVQAAVRWLRAHAREYGLDPDRLGGYGNSAGAHLVAMLGLAPDLGVGPHTDYSCRLQAVCCTATPTDLLLFNSDPNRLAAAAGLFGGPASTVLERVRGASPIHHVGDDAPPFLVIHGTADRTVPVAHGDNFVQALREAGAERVTYLRIEGAGHGVFGQHADATRPAMQRFFQEALERSE